MSTEDWEQRFEAVVRETERNLAKVKGTLQQTPTKYKASENSSPNRNILLDLTSPYKPTNTTSHSYKLTSNTSPVNYRTPTRNSQNTHNGYSITRDTGVKAVTFSSSPRDVGCHKELWQQENEILNLRKQISLLQQSNVHYEQETKLLKSQVQSLKNKHNSPSAHTRDFSRELDKFKDEVMAEIRRVKQDRGGLGSSDGFVEKELSAIRKDVDTSKLRQAEDFQEIKNDMEKLRSRLVQIELEVKSAMSDTKECMRKCQRINSEASHFSETMRLQNRSTSSQLQSLNDNCAHLSILRSTVSDIEGRLSSLEGSVSRSSPFRNESNTPGSLRNSSSTRASTRGSSLIADLAFSSKSRQTPIKGKRKGVIDELDLSLEDLSLLSDDIDDDDDDDVALDKSVDISQISESSTFKENKDKDLNQSLTESVSMGGATLSMAGDLMSGISGILSDEDIS